MGTSNKQVDQSPRKEDGTMFKKDQFIQDCINAASESKESIREIMAEAVGDPRGIISELGEPKHHEHACTVGLTEIKEKYDPKNIFNLNQNIKPT